MGREVKGNYTQKNKTMDVEKKYKSNFEKDLILNYEQIFNHYFLHTFFK